MNQIIGWVGVGLIVGAYGLNVFGVVSAADLIYGMMNLFGAASIIVSSYSKRDLQPVILNTFWILIALIGIIRSIF